MAGGVELGDVERGSAQTCGEILAGAKEGRVYHLALGLASFPAAPGRLFFYSCMFTS
jgi:hypothetical protein